MLQSAHWLPALIEYAVLCRVPLLFGAVLFLLPVVCFSRAVQSLLRGLFELTPLSAFATSIAAAALAAASSYSTLLILACAQDRFRVAAPAALTGSIRYSWNWPVLTIILSLPVAFKIVSFSAAEGHARAPLIVGVSAGLLLITALTFVLEKMLFLLPADALSHRLQALPVDLRAGYDSGPEILDHHLLAAFAVLALLIIYLTLGVYGYRRLGKRATVPALCSALMLLTLMCTALSGISFFVDRWRLLLLIILGAIGVVTAQSRRSDHYYNLCRRLPDTKPDPGQVIGAGPRRIIVAACAGGGIQAAAWTAHVLWSLQQDPGEEFKRALRLLSTVSGGSVGAVYFLHALDAAVAKDPVQASSDSSLDGVAWGLAWPDFLRSILPWFFGGFIGRGRALEKEWCLNGSQDPQQGSRLDIPLSSWNTCSQKGTLPGIIMNATICETGERLLLGTTGFSGRLSADKARRDASDLHGPDHDVSIVTAARLSATFPFVTPASRSTLYGPQPHVVDGGYYDNYGMATLVEWLEEALESAGDAVESVLVLQIHGVPVSGRSEQTGNNVNRGWFYQLFAPLSTLVNVRSAGQVAHNDIELGLLQGRWHLRNIPIHSVLFEFSKPDPPLSWHLTPSDKQRIAQEWSSMTSCVHKVREFLGGSDDFDCGCPRCTQRVSTRSALVSS